jgi:hypothetical protein
MTSFQFIPDEILKILVLRIAFKLFKIQQFTVVPPYYNTSDGQPVFCLSVAMEHQDRA